MRGCWPKALASPLPVIQKAASAPISAPAAPIEVSQTQNPPNQRHASLRASPAACERLLAVWGLMPESAESYAKAVWSSFGPPVFTGEKDVRPPEG